MSKDDGSKEGLDSAESNSGGKVRNGSAGENGDQSTAPAGETSESPGAADDVANGGSLWPRVKPVPDQRLSRSLEYGVAILESFSRERRGLGIVDLADIVGISRSTAHRNAITLVALGYLEQDSHRKYRLSARAVGPGIAAIGAIRRQVHARAVLEELREQTGYTVSMGVLDRAQVIYIYRLLGHRAGQYAIDGDLGVGTNIPVYCTALGKVLLVGLSDAERRELLESVELIPYGPNTIIDRRELACELNRTSPRGVLVSDEELFAGARSIAVLVPRPSGEHPMAIDVTVPSTAYTVKELTKKIGPLVERTARLVSGR